MAKKRLSPNQLSEVKANFVGLKQIADYESLKDEYKVAAIQTIETELDALLVKEAQLSAQLDDTRDQIAAKGADFSERMVGATQQIIAQH